MNPEKINAVIQKIKNKKQTIGTWIQIADKSIVKILSSCEFDWIVIDLEHGVSSAKDLPFVFDTMRHNDVFPMARISSHSAIEVKQVLDAGAGGIIAPMIKTVEEAESIVKSVKYPPLGIRGIGFSSVNCFGANFSSYFNSWNEDSIVIVQIEHIQGVENLHDILMVEGIDGFIVGPYDLSGSMNLTGQFDSTEFKSAIQKTIDIGRSSKKAMGFHLVEPSPDEAIKKIKDGFDFLAYSIDAFALYKHFINDLEIINNTITRD